MSNRTSYRGSSAARGGASRFSSVAHESYQYGSAAPKRQPKRRVDVVPGGGQAPDTSAAHSLAIKIAKFAVMAAIVFAGIGFARVVFSSATVTEAIENKNLESRLVEARSNISKLEVQQSILSNPSRIKSEAAALGMSSPEAVPVMTLPADVVVTDSEGNLMLSGSIDVAASSVSQ